MKLSDIPAAWKVGSGGVVVVLAIMAYLSTYETKAEAQQYQVQHGQQLNLFRVQQIETQIAQYRYQLLSAQLTPAQRQWIESEIARLQAQIACIRAGQC